MNSSLKRGFTLIELLVVIAIIGILSAVVLASLSTARAKAADTTIKGDISGARAQADIYYDNQTPKSYTGVCASASGLAPMKSGSQTAGSADVVCYDTSNHAGTDSWTMSAQLKSDTAQYFCTDSTGVYVFRASQVAVNATSC